jgi:hypothetical protein
MIFFQVYTMDGVGSAQLHELTAAAHHQTHDEDEDDHHVIQIIMLLFKSDLNVVCNIK